MTIKTKEGKIFASEERSDLSRFEKFNSLGHYLLYGLSNKSSDFVIFVDDATGRRWTGAELKNKVLNVSTALIDKYNFQQGTFACISYEHSDLSLIVALAIVCVGGVVASAFPLDPYAELLYLARKVEPKFLFSNHTNLNWAKRLENDLGTQVVNIVMGELVSEVKNVVSNEGNTPIVHIQDLLSYDSSKSESLDRVPVACKAIDRDLALVIMSSGTTGLPKVVPVTHWNCLVELGTFTMGLKGINIGSIAPLDYVSGRLILFGAIEAGYTAVILRSSDPKSFLEAVEKYKFKIIHMGAASFYALITYNDIDNYDLSSVRSISPLGAKIIYLKELGQFLAKHPNIVEVRQAYGTSEFCVAAVNRMSPDVYLEDSDNCGNLDGGVKAKIVDSVSGELLGHNQEGVLHIKSKSLFPGYYDVQQSKGKTDYKQSFIRDESTFDEDGFYITGDMAYFNERDQLYIVGRQKELMNCRNGKKVVPQELEEMIIQHRAVDSVCVLGIPSKLEPTLHCPRAFVVPKPSYYSSSQHDYEDKILKTTGTNHDLDVEELKFTGEHKLCSLSCKKRRKLSEDIVRFINARISWEKQLTGGLVIIDQIPTLRATGKMNKGYLRSLATDQVEIYGDRSG